LYRQRNVFNLHLPTNSANISLINTEKGLINGCLAGDALCQRQLFDLYAGKMMTVCLRYAADQMEAEDLLMEAFIKVYRYMYQYKFEGSFEGWMRRIVVNTALKKLQKKKLYFEEIKPERITEAADASAYMQLGEKELLDLIRDLPDGYRIVFNLFVIEGYNHDEIAEMLNIQAGTSRSQLVKARKLLQQKIADQLKTVAA
jgi:RNA polymerase sigma factor (sigma-70 family)